MKKIILLLLFINYSLSIKAQYNDYVLRIEYTIVGVHNKTYCDRSEIVIYYLYSNKKQKVYRRGLEGLKPGKITGGVFEDIISTVNMPDYIEIYTGRYYKGCNKGGAGSCFTEKLSIGSICYKDFKQGLDGYDHNSSVNITIKPKSINLKYDSSIKYKGDSLILPDKHKITLKTKENYPSNNFKWEYQIGEIKSQADKWAPYYIYTGHGCNPYDPEKDNCAHCLDHNGCLDDYPNECIINDCGYWIYKDEFVGTEWRTIPAGNGKSEIEFCGNDLPGLTNGFIYDILLAKKQVRVRLNYGCGYSEPIVLDGMKSAPTIKSYEVINNHCAGESSAQIKLKFSEPLLNNETLYLGLNKFDESNAEITSFASDTSYTFTGLKAGTYKVIMIGKYPDSNTATFTNSEHHSPTIAINDPTPLSFSAEKISDVKCSGGQDGEIKVTMNGGAFPYKILYNRNNGSTIVVDNIQGRFFFIKNLSKGTYKVRFQDKYGCTVKNNYGEEYFEVINISEPKWPVSFDRAEAFNLNSYKGSDGRIEVNGRGGSGGYSYSWEKDGQIYIPYPSDSVANNLAAGIYQITIKDKNFNLASKDNNGGCWETINVVVEQPDSLEATINVIKEIRCSGDSNGSLKAILKGGNPPYKNYKWEKWNSGYWEIINSYSGDVIDGLTTGKYRVTANDSKSYHVISPEFYLTEPAPLVLKKINFEEPSCNNYSDGWIEVQVSGGRLPYTYNWQGSNNKKSRIENLPEGYYLFTVSDSAGYCSINDSKFLDQPTVLSGSLSTTLPSSHDGTDGSIEVTVSGGSPGYSYQWNYEGSTSNPLTHLSARDEFYRVQVRDGRGCTLDLSTRLIYPLGVSISVLDSISCHGFTDGRLNAESFGGVGTNYTYEWYKFDGSDFVLYPGTGSVLSSVGSGRYLVKVTDSEGTVSSSSELTVQEPPVLSGTLTPTLPSSHDGTDGSIQVTVSGGSPGYHYQWNYEGSTSNPLTNLPARDDFYSVHVVDRRGCTLDLSTRLIYPLGVNLSVLDSVSCYGFTDGRLKAEPFGGVGTNYVYEWYKFDGSDFVLYGGSGSVLSSVGSGRYLVKVTDVEGNVSSSSELTVQDPTVLSGSLSTTLPSSHDGTDGSIEVTVSGGSPGYSYQWNYEGSTSNPLTNLPARDDFYSVHVVDRRGCTLDLSTRLIYPLGVNLSVLDSVSCYGFTDGRLKAEPFGGVGTNYVYEWYKFDGSDFVLYGGSGSVLSSVGSGRYLVKVTDVEGNVSSSSELTVQEPPVLSGTLTPTLPSSHDGTDGSIQVTVSGGSPGYHYQWNYEGSTSNPLTHLSARDEFYSVHVVDRRGCTLDLSTRLIYPLGVNLSVLDSVSCYGFTDGRLKAEPFGGVGTNYVYEWYKFDGSDFVLYGGSGSVLSSVGSGRYLVKVTDSEGTVSSSSELTVQEPPVLSGTLTPTLPSSHDGTDGSIQVTVSGGSPGYHYQWNYEGSTSNPLTNLPARDDFYSVHVVDRRGCTLDLSTRLIYPLGVNLSVLDSVSCYGFTDGRLKAEPFGGVGTNYVYEWYKFDGSDFVLYGGSGSVLSSVGSGRYLVKVTDSEGTVSSSSELTVQDPTVLSGSLSTTLPSSHDGTDGSIEVTVSGGSPGYSYQWNYEGSTSNPLTNLPARDDFYSVHVVDRRGCTLDLSTRLIYPLTAKIKVLDSISCYAYNNGRIEVEVVGGVGKNYTYEWYKIKGNLQDTLSDDRILSGINEGNYKVKVTDVEGNFVYADLEFDVPEPLIVSEKITLPTKHDASDGAIFLEVTGGTFPYKYIWKHSNLNQNPITGIPAKDDPYEVMVIDYRGCRKTIYPRIIYPLEVDVFIKDSISCNNFTDGSLQVNTVGGVGKSYTYQWYKVDNNIEKAIGVNSNVLENIGKGIYKVRVTDIEGNYLLSKELLFNDPGKLLIKPVVTNLKCKFDNDGFAQLLVTGGVPEYKYLWSNGQTGDAINLLAEGKYIYTVTDRRGCYVKDSINITAPDELTISMCHTPPKAFNSSDATVGVKVEGGTAPYKYYWKGRNDTTSLITNIPYGLYTVIVTDANGCSKELSEVIKNPPLLQVFTSIVDSISCKGYSNGRLSAVSNGGVGAHRYIWYRVNGDNLEELLKEQTIANISAGVYKVKVIDDNDIEAISSSLIFNDPDLLKISMQPNHVNCNGDSDGWIEATPNGGTAPYNYHWSSGHTTYRAENLTEDNYFVFINDSRGCEAKASSEIIAISNLTIDTTVYHPKCNNSEDGSIHLSVTGGISPYTYLWEDGSSIASRKNLKAGLYTVKIMGANGCSKDVSMSLNNPIPFVIDLGNDLTLCKEQKVELNATIADSFAKYQWYCNGKAFSQTPIVTVTEKGTYSIEVISSHGCKSTASITVAKQEDEIVADFTVSSQTILDEVTKLVNISHPHPEVVEWIIPDDPNIKVVFENEEYADIVFKANGTYIIGLRSKVGKCQSTIYKSVEVVHKHNFNDHSNKNKEPFIKQFIVYPNPSSGTFIAKIELNEQAEICLRLVDLTGTLIDDRIFKGNKSYEVLYEINSKPGVHILQLISNKTSSTLKLLLNQY